jgi:hypothetical protein
MKRGMHGLYDRRSAEKQAILTKNVELSTDNKTFNKIGLTFRNPTNRTHHPNHLATQA